MSSEFDLIEKYFNWRSSSASLLHGVGDDAAVVQVPVGKQLVITTDTLISGVHFPENTPPHAIGYKSLAVNLSDLAAMGADPAWFALAITFPELDKFWIRDFSIGLRILADETNILLIGGDTTKGSLSISITAMGLADEGDLLLRSSAKDGDYIYVTGTLGDAAAGLAMMQNKNKLAQVESCVRKLNYPQPRNNESKLIRSYAKACLDISDGFLADLNHILDASEVGARIDIDNIPLSEPLQQIDQQIAINFALSGGDDYELLFTIAEKDKQLFEQFIHQNNLECSVVGRIDASVKGIVSTYNEVLNPEGYDHFRNNN